MGVLLSSLNKRIVFISHIRISYHSSMFSQPWSTCGCLFGLVFSSKSCLVSADDCKLTKAADFVFITIYSNVVNAILLENPDLESFYTKWADCRPSVLLGGVHC